MMAELKAPDAIKNALFSEDPAASVSEAQWQVIQELARLHALDSRRAIDEALRILSDSPDAGIQLIAARLLAALPQVGEQPDDLKMLVAAARGRNQSVRRTLSAALLSGRFEYRPEIREMCRDWLGGKRAGSVHTDAGAVTAWTPRHDRKSLGDWKALFGKREDP